MSKIKVLQFPIAKLGGGITNYALNNWKFIDRSKYQFDFATRFNNLGYEEKVIAEGCKIKYFNTISTESENSFAKQFSEILDDGYDVVHLHTSFWKGLLAEEIAIEKNISKIIVHSHSCGIAMEDKSEYSKALKLHNKVKEEFNQQLATDFWACSEIAADWLFPKHIDQNKIKIMKNAIDLDRFSFKSTIRDNVRAKLGLENKFVLGQIGRYVEGKNHLFTIDVFNEIHKEFKNTVLVLRGHGVLETEIKKRVEQYGLKDSIIFLSVNSEISIESTYQIIDLLLFPSEFEALGLVAVEAQASGVKCFLSDSFPTETCIVGELIKYLPLNKEKWIEQIADTIKYSYERMSRDSEIIVAGYDLKTQIKELEKEYSEF